MSFQLVTQVCAAAWTGECIGDASLNAADVATIQGITCLLSNLLTPLPAIIALAAVVMIIMAGIRIINAGADAKALAAAWSTFTYAIIGLILMSVIWLALVLVKNFTGADVTNLKFQ